MLRVAFLASCLFTAVNVVSGQAFMPIDRSAMAGRFIEPPRSVMQQLRVAQDAIDQRRYGEAVAILGDLLQRERTVLDDELSGQDFFISDASGAATPQVNQTLMGEARRLLGSLPAVGIAQYELIYGAQAKKLLDDAAAQRTWSDVAEVKRRFFHTEAGRDATQLLIHRAMAQGHSIHAQRMLRLLLEHPKLEGKSKSLVSELIQSLDQVTAIASSTSEKNQEIAATRFATIRKRRSEAAAEFRMYTGQSLTAQSAGGQMPLPDPLYTIVTTGSERQERTLRESVDAMSAMGELPPPSWLPLRVGNQLLMRTTERLVGVDVVTGKRVWQYPWFETNEKVESSETTFDGLPEEDSGQSLLKQRVWNDLPYGRLSSDGERVYVLGDLAQMQVAMFSPLMGMQGTRPADTGTNSLIALDLATEGKLVWQLGGDVAAPSGMPQVFFLAAPLPIDDALYVMAEISGDVMLLCLDSATGTERWRQQLLAIETGSIDTDPVRRVAGGAASYQDGVLVCSTGAGAIVAVDIHDRALLWGVTIERNDAINQSVIVRREGFIPDQLTKRWWDATPVIVDKTVFVTPIEADRFFALDLLTGSKRWKEFARAQTGSRYLAGVHENSIVLVGGDNVRAVDAATGKTTWKTRVGWLDSGEQISGLGMFGMIEHPATKDSVAAYYVPTSANRIIAVSLQDGSALAHQTTSFPAGNLIAVEGQIISQAATLLSVAEGQISLAPKVAAALNSDPNNVIMMNRKAQLLMEQGQRVEALKWLDKARAIEPDNIEVQQLTINAMFGALRDDFTGNANLLSVLDRLIDQPADRAELIKLQVRAAIDRRRPVEAVSRLIDLSSLLPTDPMLAAQASSNDVDSARQVSLDSWINARVMEALQTAQSDQRDEISSAISTHLDKYAASSTLQLQRLVLQFGSLPGAEPLIRQLLQRYSAEKQWLAMERMILASASATPERLDRLSSWQAVAIASAYAEGGLKQDAAAALEVAFNDEQAAQRSAVELGIDLDALKAQALGDPYAASWGTKVKVQLPNEPPGDRIPMSRRISTAENKRVVGRSFAGWQLISEDSSPVALRDPLGIVHPIPVDGRNRHEEAHRQVVFNGGLMIALLPGELVAVNLFDLVDGQVDPVLWRRPWRSEGGGSGFRPQSQSTDFGDQSYRYLLSTGGSNAIASELQLGPIVGDTFYLLQGNELIAMDAVSKATRWRNLEAPRGGAIVCDGKTVAVVSPASQVIVKYDCRDGNKLGETPFTDFNLWSATDDSVLLYRELPEGKRELVLMNPISGETLLNHRFEGLNDGARVLGRIVEGSYAVTLATTGKMLIWDLENARVVSDSQVDAIPELSGLHVLARHDSVVLLPAVIDAPDDSGSVPTSTVSSDEHVRVDVAVWAVDLKTGKITWNTSLNKESWGCTLTQSPVSPLVLLSRSKLNYLPTGSRMRSLDVMAIDARDGTVYPTLDLPVAHFNNDIATRVTVQPPQQRVIVNIGATTIDYDLSDRAVSGNKASEQK